VKNEYIFDLNNYIFTKLSILSIIPRLNITTFWWYLYKHARHVIPVPVSQFWYYRPTLLHINFNWTKSQSFLKIFLEWSGVDNILYYTTFNNLHRANKVWRHEIGQDTSKDELIFEENDARSVYCSLNILIIDDWCSEAFEFLIDE
jgi:hypothetical protein